MKLKKGITDVVCTRVSKIPKHRRKLDPWAYRKKCIGVTKYYSLKKKKQKHCLQQGNKHNEAQKNS